MKMEFWRHKEKVFEMELPGEGWRVETVLRSIDGAFQASGSYIISKEEMTDVKACLKEANEIRFEKILDLEKKLDAVYSQPIIVESIDNSGKQIEEECLIPLTEEELEKLSKTPHVRCGDYHE